MTINVRRSITGSPRGLVGAQPYYAFQQGLVSVGGCPLSGEFRVATERLNLAETEVTHV